MKKNSKFSSLVSAFMASAGIGSHVIVGGLAILLTSVNLSTAQEFSESHITAAKTAITVTNATKNLDNILPAAVGRLTSNLIQNRPDIEAQITQIVNEKAIELAPRRGDLEKEVAQIYARVFSQEELASINEFFGTEVGQKFLTELPVILREVDGASRVWSTGINRDLGESVRKQLETDGL